MAFKTERKRTDGHKKHRKSGTKEKKWKDVGVLFSVFYYLCSAKAVGRLAAGDTFFINKVRARGKSGQHRALRYLTGRSQRWLARAEEKNRRKVRVRRWGKSPPAAWRRAGCAHRRLKVRVNRRRADCGLPRPQGRERAARPSRRVER